MKTCTMKTLIVAIPLMLLSGQGHASTFDDAIQAAKEVATGACQAAKEVVLDPSECQGAKVVPSNDPPVDKAFLDMIAEEKDTLAKQKAKYEQDVVRLSYPLMALAVLLPIVVGMYWRMVMKVMTIATTLVLAGWVAWQYLTPVQVTLLLAGLFVWLGLGTVWDLLT